MQECWSRPWHKKDSSFSLLTLIIGEVMLEKEVKKIESVCACV